MPQLLLVSRFLAMARLLMEPLPRNGHVTTYMPTGAATFSK
jgi:hypothetical protein